MADGDIPPAGVDEVNHPPEFVTSKSVKVCIISWCRSVSVSHVVSPAVSLSTWIQKQRSYHAAHISCSSVACTVSNPTPEPAQQISLGSTYSFPAWYVPTPNNPAPAFLHFIIRTSREFLADGGYQTCDSRSAAIGLDELISAQYLSLLTVDGY
jgi:hypothetical protein